jgi:hypothetical protein
VADLPAALADRIALHDLVEAYAFAADDRDADALASLFVPGGVIAVYRNGPNRPATAELHAPGGLGEIVESLARYDQTFHVVGNHRVELVGDTATGDVYCEAHHVGGGRDRVFSIRYADSYRRTPAGWRFEHRDVNVLWITECPVEANR